MLRAPRFNKMVEYVLCPAKDKTIDPEPLFYNCTVDDIMLSGSDEKPALAQNQLNFHDIVMEVHQLAKDGVPKDEVYLHISQIVQKKDAWMLMHVMATYDSTSAVALPAYIPAELDDGSLDNALPFQRAACTWLERGPVREADGLWIKAPQGSGKTLLLKLLQLRYPGQIFPAAIRGSKGGYDATSVIKYKHEPVIFFNSLKPKKVYSEMVWSIDLLEILESMTDGLPMSLNWGTANYSFTVVAKIVVVSTFDRPDTKDILRRYSLLTVTDEAGTAAYQEHDGHLGTKSGRFIVLKEGLEEADRFPITDGVADAILAHQESQTTCIDESGNPGDAERPDHEMQTSCSAVPASDDAFVDGDGHAGPGDGISKQNADSTTDKASMAVDDLLSRFPNLSCGNWGTTPTFIAGVSIGWRKFVIRMEEAVGLAEWIHAELYSILNARGTPLQCLDQAAELIIDSNPTIEQSIVYEEDLLHFQMTLEAILPHFFFENGMVEIDTDKDANVNMDTQAADSQLETPAADVDQEMPVAEAPPEVPVADDWFDKLFADVDLQEIVPDAQPLTPDQLPSPDSDCFAPAEYDIESD